MKLRICRLLAVVAFVSCFLAGARALAQSAYITQRYSTNGTGHTVSVIDTAKKVVTATISVGQGPLGVSVTPDGGTVYVTNQDDSTVSVIATATNAVTATIPVGRGPSGVSVIPDGSKVYVVNETDNTVSVIDTTTNAVTATIPVGRNPFGVSVTPDGSKVYVTNQYDNTVSVIATATNAVTATIPVGGVPQGVAVSPDGSKVYVTNQHDNTVSVIATATNAVTATIPVGRLPLGVSVLSDGSKVYVVNAVDNTVSVIDTTTNAVTAIIPVGQGPYGLSATPDSSKVYVANYEANSLSVIDTGTNTVTATIPAGTNTNCTAIPCRPTSLGVFIQPDQVSPYSSLLLINGGKEPAFAFTAFFAAGAGSTVIDPPAQAVTLHVGPYTATIPAGSFRQVASDRIAQTVALLAAMIPVDTLHQLVSGPSVTAWTFSGTLGKVRLALDIVSLGHSSYQLGATAGPVDLTPAANPIIVSYSIGNNGGLAAVRATLLP
jgi:YVTN family beta-propeller protein